MSAPVGVLNGNSRHNRLTADEIMDAQVPGPYDIKLRIIKATMPDYETWYQEIVNLPGPAWRAEIDDMMLKLCDADGRAVSAMTTKQARDSAKRCGCITCTGALENVRNSIMWYAQSAKIHRQARSNRWYFIQQLREALASAVIKHDTGE